jgi:hypothetical protein
VLVTGGAAAPAAFAAGVIATTVVAGVPAAPVATPVVVLGSAALPAAGKAVFVAGGDAGKVALPPLDAVGEPQPRFEASAWKAKKVATIGENFIELQAQVEWLLTPTTTRRKRPAQRRNSYPRHARNARLRSWGKMLCSAVLLQDHGSSKLMPAADGGRAAIASAAAAA